MTPANHERFARANRELRTLLQQVECIAASKGAFTERELNGIRLSLAAREPEVGDAACSETLDASSCNEMAEFVANFGALQNAVERVRVWTIYRSIADSMPRLPGLSEITYFK